MSDEGNFPKNLINPNKVKYAEFLQRTISIVESSTVSPQALLDLQKLMGFHELKTNKLTPFDLNAIFVKKYRDFISMLPLSMFYSEAMRDKLLQSLRTFSENIEKARPVPPSHGMKFLKHSKKASKPTS
jgi:hypothetical protein